MKNIFTRNKKLIAMALSIVVTKKRLDNDWHMFQQKDVGKRT